MLVYTDSQIKISRQKKKKKPSINFGIKNFSFKYLDYKLKTNLQMSQLIS